MCSSRKSRFIYKTTRYIKYYVSVVFILWFVYFLQFWNIFLPKYKHDQKHTPIFNEGYLLNNKTICSGIAQITALVVVHTATHHFQRRENIRKTYGSRDLFLPAEVRVVFLLGKVTNPKTQDDINREFNKHGDVVQGDFIDSYHNLTIKGVMGLHWVSRYCPHVKYVVKLDDDVIFDMWKFLNVFNANNLYASKTLYCDVSFHGIIRRVGKWAVPDHILKGLANYPFPHCYGFVVIISGDVISDLYRATFRVPFFWVDDVYLFGMLPYEIQGISIKLFRKDMILKPKFDGLKCLQEKGEKCPVLAVTYSDNTFNDIWKLIKHRNHFTKTGSTSAMTVLPRVQHRV
ncbi:beta-1,3-galactosyltransferase 5 isoform X2 [Patella vulgata]|nr:beta-1,3-galactosyltransferase 5 isoform X2 [Patella vulgata]XP_050404509.1 beta-1,3-galactosyltransferase 5 isoform X2 [Patella vulgata]